MIIVTGKVINLCSLMEISFSAVVFKHEINLRIQDMEKVKYY